MNFTKIVLSACLVLGVSSTAKSQTDDFFDFGKLESYLNTIHQKNSLSGEILVAKFEEINIIILSTVTNNLYAKLGNNPAFEIHPKENHQFFGIKLEIEFTFAIINDLIAGLSAERMGHFFHFKKDKR